MKRRDGSGKDDADKWDDGTFGQAEEFVKSSSKQRELAVDEGLGLEMISIRLQKSLIADLRELAKEEGISYQPFVRQILTKYVRQAKKSQSANKRLART